MHEYGCPFAIHHVLAGNCLKTIFTSISDCFCASGTHQRKESVQSLKPRGKRILKISSSPQLDTEDTLHAINSSRDKTHLIKEMHIVIARVNFLLLY